jgi:hypothetical protein
MIWLTIGKKRVGYDTARTEFADKFNINKKMEILYRKTP